MCRATNTAACPWTDFNATALWRQRLWVHASYLRHLRDAGKPAPSLFDVHGFGVGMIMPDALHTVDLGCASHIIGNILFECLKHFGRAQASQIVGLQEDMKAFYKKANVANRLHGKLTLDQLRTTNSWPKLKGKAAAVRALAPYAAEVAARFNSGSEHDQRRLQVATDLCCFYSTIKSEGRLLSKGALSLLRQVGLRLPGTYAHLAKEALEAGIKAWKLVPKFHIFQHMVGEHAARWGNPRFWWCYSDEDMVGQCIEVAQSCHHNTMSHTALYKWLVLHFED